MVDFAATRVWDVHAQPFLDRGQVSADDFVRLTAFGGGAEAYFEQGGIEPTAEISVETQRWKRQTTWHKLLVRELADYFGVARSLDAVVAARNEAVASGYRDYVGKVYESAQIDGIIFEFLPSPPPVPVPHCFTLCCSRRTAQRERFHIQDDERTKHEQEHQNGFLLRQPQG